MAKLSLRDLGAELKGKRILMRVDFNVPLDDKQNITDDTRIQAALESIKFVINNGGKLILMSHLGRPKGEVLPEFSLAPVAKRLSELLGKPVKMEKDCIGAEVENDVANMQDGDVMLLENVRFHKEETKNIPEFSEKLAKLGDIYINDAFGSAHRAHCSTEGVTAFIKKSAAGFLMEKELKFLGGALADPQRPFVAILGGAKVSTKIGVIENLMKIVDTLILGGGMAYTFYKAQGKEIGTSLLEADKVELAAELLKKAKDSKVNFLLPIDNLVADKFDASANTKIVSTDEIPADYLGVDIGPKSIELFGDVIKNAKTIIWNGPMGVFEIDAFAKGTNTIAQMLADSNATTIVGGGDSVSALNKANLTDKMTHVSTGGGASLEFLEGIQLPGVAALTDK